MLLLNVKVMDIFLENRPITTHLHVKTLLLHLQVHRKLGLRIGVYCIISVLAHDSSLAHT